MFELYHLLLAILALCIIIIFSASVYQWRRAEYYKAQWKGAVSRLRSLAPLEGEVEDLLDFSDDLEIEEVN